MYIYVLRRSCLTTYMTVTMSLCDFIHYMHDIEVSNMHNVVWLVWTRLIKQEIKSLPKGHSYIQWRNDQHQIKDRSLFLWKKQMFCVSVNSNHVSSVLDITWVNGDLWMTLVWTLPCSWDCRCEVSMRYRYKQHFSVSKGLINTGTKWNYHHQNICLLKMSTSNRDEKARKNSFKRKFHLNLLWMIQMEW